MQIYIGYSMVHSPDQIIEWLDVDPSHPEGTSRFERMFGCGYIRPGDFEVYGIEDMDQGFTVAEIKKYFPFETGELNLWKKPDLEAASCVFWIKSESQWESMEANGIAVCDKVNIVRFFFENGA